MTLSLSISLSLCALTVSQALSPWLANVGVLFSQGASEDRLAAVLDSVLPLGSASAGVVWDALISGPAADHIAAIAAKSAATLLANRVLEHDDTNAAGCRDAAACAFFPPPLPLSLSPSLHR
jgi:hypothetical protein